MKKHYKIGSLSIDLSHLFITNPKQQFYDFIELFYNRGIGFLLGVFYALTSNEVLLIVLGAWLFFHIQIHEETK